jgi:hypothetical protein
MKTLLDLAESLEAKAFAVGDAGSMLAVDTALAIVGNLAYSTPVDRSTALSNWIVTLDSPATLQIDAHFPGKQGSTYRASAEETIKAAKRVLKNKKPGQKIFITNPTRYIKRLNNDGHSKQVPNGFIERAVLIGRKIKAKFKLKV